MARTSNLAFRHGFNPANAKEQDLRTFTVASAYGTAIYPGDPVLLVSDGTVARTPAGTNQAAATDGITAVVTRIVQYKDSTGKVRRSGVPYLPASTSWTAHEERSIVEVVMVDECPNFFVKTDAAVASLAVARSLVGNNVEHEYSGTDSALGLSGARVVIGGAATTALQWRIVGVPDMAWNDPTVGAFVVEVKANKQVYLPPLGSSTTGV